MSKLDAIIKNLLLGKIQDVREARVRATNTPKETPKQRRKRKAKAKRTAQRRNR